MTSFPRPASSSIRLTRSHSARGATIGGPVRSGPRRPRRPHLPRQPCHAMPCSLPLPPPEIPRLPHRASRSTTPAHLVRPACVLGAISIRPGTLECGRALGAVVARQRYVGTPRDDWPGRDVWCVYLASASCPPPPPLRRFVRAGPTQVPRARAGHRTGRGSGREWELVPA